MLSISSVENIGFRKIVHVDMDAFFASVEELDNPLLKGKPVIVGSDPKNGQGRGVVSTCNYIARRYGVHSAQPISKAFRLCSHAVFLRPRLARYSSITEQIRKIFCQFSPRIENVSIDESYLDCTGTDQLFGNSRELGDKIREQIFNQSGLTASIGIASNKYIAKISSDLNKPKGLTICEPGEEQHFLSKLPIDRLWGAGKSTLSKLKSSGFYSIGDFANTPESAIPVNLGKRGASLWKLANGIDNRPVVSNQGRKSISKETTFEFDIDNEFLLIQSLSKIAENIGYSLRKENYKFKTVQLKIRLSDFSTYTRNHTLPFYSNSTKTIREFALKLYSNFQKVSKVRLIGISLQQLIEESNSSQQLYLFDKVSSRERNSSDRDKIYDLIKSQYRSKIKTAYSL